MYEQAIITIEKIDDENVVRFHVNKINILNAKDIETLLMNLINVSENNVVLDLSGLKFIDSTGFTMLHKLKINSYINNIEIKYINISSDLQDLMNFTSRN